MVINGAVPAVQHVRPAAEEADGEVKGSNVTEQGRSISTPQSPSSAAGGCAGHVDRLLLQNRCARLPAAVMPVPTATQQTLDFLLLLPLDVRRWAAERVAADPHYFERLCNIQTPEYLWIGCSDSRVPANVIVGLEPGEVRHRQCHAMGCQMLCLLHAPVVSALHCCCTLMAP